MPILDSNQRKNLTLQERQRIGVLVSNYVRNVMTPEEHLELKGLYVKANAAAGVQLPLLERINNVINTKAFEHTLDENGSSVCDFQATWSTYKHFEALPDVFKDAILAGESELTNISV